jgi:hypothetical protein
MNAHREPSDGDTKPCPQCRDTLVFMSDHAVLSVGLLTPGSPNVGGIRYERAWVCRNGGCDYRELVGAA